MKLNRKTKYLALVEVLDNQEIKVTKAQKLTNLNQYARKWQPIDARNFSRALNKSNLVIK